MELSLVKKPINLSQNIVNNKKVSNQMTGNFFIESVSENFVHENGCSNTGIKALNMAIHRNGNHFIDLFLMLLEMPFPSFPMMRAIFPLYSIYGKGVPFISVPKVQKPSSLSLSRVWLRLVTRAMGTCSIAPVAVLATTE